MQDATPLTLGQGGPATPGCGGRSGADRSSPAGGRTPGPGGTAWNGHQLSARLCRGGGREIARLTSLPFVTAPNKFAVQGAHDALVQLFRHASYPGGVALQDWQ